jgi:hypothetical protein
MKMEIAESRYKRTDYVPRKPYPCYEGIKNTMQLHDSNEMRRYTMQDFYDDNLMRELDESGFLDGLYNWIRATGIGVTPSFNTARSGPIR